MGIVEVREYFAKHKMDNRILEFESSSATVLLAAQALNCEPGRIAKSLAFYDEDGGMLVIAAGDVRVDSGKFKRQFGFRTKMMSAEDTASILGHAVGGVCPFAIKAGVRVYTDLSLKRFDTVFPACGSANSAIELSCDELFFHSGSLAWIDVCKPIE